MLSLRLKGLLELPAQALRELLLASGLILSVFPPDIVRISMPALELAESEVDQIANALQHATQMSTELLAKS